MSKFAVLSGVAGVGTVGAAAVAVMTGVIDLSDFAPEARPQTAVVAPDVEPGLVAPAPGPQAALAPAAENPDAASQDSAGDDADSAVAPVMAPRFDLVRSDPDGTTLIAGKAEPFGDVSLLVDGETSSTTQVGGDGQFVLFADLPPSENGRVLSLELQIDDRIVVSDTEVILAPTLSPPVDVAAVETPAAPEAELAQLDESEPLGSEPAVTEADPVEQITDEQADVQTARIAVDDGAGGSEELASTDVPVVQEDVPETAQAVVPDVDAQEGAQIAVVQDEADVPEVGDISVVASDAIPTEPLTAQTPDDVSELAQAAQVDATTQEAVIVENVAPELPQVEIAEVAEETIDTVEIADVVEIAEAAEISEPLEIAEAVAPGAPVTVEAVQEAVAELVQAPAVEETVEAIEVAVELATEAVQPEPEAVVELAEAAEIPVLADEAEAPQQVIVLTQAELLVDGLGTEKAVAEDTVAEEVAEIAPEVAAQTLAALAPLDKAPLAADVTTARVDARAVVPSAVTSGRVSASIDSDAAPVAPLADAGLSANVATPDVFAAPDAAPEPAAGGSGTDGAPVARAKFAAATDLPEQPVAPPVLLSSPEGVEVLLAAPLPPGDVALDAISYDAEGDVLISGRGEDTASVRIYLDNKPIATSRIREDGRWRTTLPEIDTGTYTLRIDQIGQDGAVLARVESPFLREDPEVLAEARADGPIKAITVQPGNTLWAIARDRYGEGLAYVRVFDANKDRIRNPDLIYPGQIFDLPE